MFFFCGKRYIFHHHNVFCFHSPICLYCHLLITGLLCNHLFLFAFSRFPRFQKLALNSSHKQLIKWQTNKARRELGMRDEGGEDAEKDAWKDREGGNGGGTEEEWEERAGWGGERELADCCISRLTEGNMMRISRIMKRGGSRGNVSRKPPCLLGWISAVWQVWHPGSHDVLTIKRTCGRAALLPFFSSNPELFSARDVPEPHSLSRYLSLEQRWRLPALAANALR